MTKLLAHEPGRSVWQWSAFHPEWKHDVHSHVVETRTSRIVIDPQLPTDAHTRSDLLGRLTADDRELVIVALLDYHRRSTCELAAEIGAAVVAHAAYADRIGCVTETVSDLSTEIRSGVTALPTGRGNEFALWFAAGGALAAGDVLLGDDRGRVRVCPQSWLDRPRLAVAGELRPLLRLPVEVILLGHGCPVTERASEQLRAAIEEAEGSE